MSEDVDDLLSLDDMLDGLGVPDYLQGKTPEERFYTELTNAKMSKIYNTRYWLNHELAVYTSMFGKNWFMSKLAKNSDGNLRSQVSLSELSRALLEYYFQMYHLPRFQPHERREACDMQKFLDLVMTNDEIKRTINQYGA